MKMNRTHLDECKPTIQEAARRGLEHFRRPDPESDHYPASMTTEKERKAGTIISDLDQAGAILSAVYDQGMLNGPDVIEPAAIMAALRLVRTAKDGIGELQAAGGQQA